MPHRATRTVLIVFFGSVAAISACSSATDASTPLIGTYTLSAVDGKALPLTKIEFDSTGKRSVYDSISSGTMTLGADSSVDIAIAYIGTIDGPAIDFIPPFLPPSSNIYHFVGRFSVGGEAITANTILNGVAPLRLTGATGGRTIRMTMIDTFTVDDLFGAFTIFDTTTYTFTHTG